MRPWAYAFGLVPLLEDVLVVDPFTAIGVLAPFVTIVPPEPTLTSHSVSPTAPSGHQHRHAAGEKHTKETGGKGKKNRNLKIGRITVSEKWRESVFRQITNANELKYLDEFLLNKVGQCGPRGPWDTSAGWKQEVQGHRSNTGSDVSCKAWAHTRPLVTYIRLGQPSTGVLHI